MNEYRVKIVVRNNLILKAIEKEGYISIKRFCKDRNITESSLFELIALRTPPIMRCGSFSIVASRLMEELCALPTELWTTEQLTMALKNNKTFINVSKEDLQISSDEALKLIFDQEKKEKVGKIVDNLRLQKKIVIKMRFGLDVEYPMTLEEVSKSLKLSKERIRQVEQQALRIMKHPKYKLKELYE
jgi:hypothetical protein